MKKQLLSFIIILLFSPATAQIITIDAQKDAFYTAITSPDNGKIFLLARSSLRNVNPCGRENGDADLSAILLLQWLPSQVVGINRISSRERGIIVNCM